MLGTPEFNATCERIWKLRLQKKEIESELTGLESSVKKDLKDAGLTDTQAGHFKVHLTVKAPTLIADTEKLKADGLFERYSKERAGSTSLMLTESKE